MRVSAIVTTQLKMAAVLWFRISHSSLPRVQGGKLKSQWTTLSAFVNPDHQWEHLLTQQALLECSATQNKFCVIKLRMLNRTCLCLHRGVSQKSIQSCRYDSATVMGKIKGQ